jgi:hypothetical protein
VQPEQLSWTAVVGGQAACTKAGTVGLTFGVLATRFIDHFSFHDNRTNATLGPRAAELHGRVGAAEVVVKAPVPAALARTATGPIVAAKSGLSRSRWWRALLFAFSLVVALANAVDMSLAAALAVTRSVAGYGQEIRLRREQTRREENANGTPSRALAREQTR